jgi:hypothetical protein
MRLVAVLAACLLALTGCGGGGGGTKKPTSSGTRDGACVRDDRFDDGNGHVPNGTSLTYSVQPPSGGDHWASPLPPGVYAPDDKVPEGPAVHSLEHGYIDVWYREGLPAADVAQLTQFVNGTQPDTLLIPLASMPVPVAATAWHHRLLCDRVDLGALRRFEQQYVNQGPEKIPH